MKANARKSPAFLKSSVIYQVFLRPFSKEGTLKAAERRLPEIAALGTDVVYLCPVCLQDDDMRKEFWSKRHQASGVENPRNPYRIKDYFKIDSEYGTEQDFRDFVAASHKSGMRVMMDIVFLHCGPAAVFIESHPDFVKRNPDGSVANGTWNFPLLDFESAELREYLAGNLEYWLKEFKVDAYRCDVSDQIPLDFWEAVRPRLEKINPDFVMLAEGQRKEDQGSAFDLDYNFSFATAIHDVFDKGAPASSVRKLWSEMRDERPDGYRFIRYTDNHDIAHDTAAGAGRIDKAWGVKAADAALAFCFLLDGVPMLYNGQELADSSKHSIYYGGETIDWSKASSPEAKARLALVKKLCSLRHSAKALSEGSLEWLDNGAPEALLSFKRSSRSQSVIAVLNFSSKSLETWIDAPVPGESAKALLSVGAKVKGSDGKGKTLVEVQPYGFMLVEI